MGPDQFMAQVLTEFHCHTNVSKDSLVTPAQLIRCCRRKSIGKVVVTDHNSIDGALEASRLAPDLVVVGEEIMTTEGEILAAYVKERIPPGLAPRETIHLLRDQNAFISISHPFDEIRSGSWKQHALLDIAPLVDAIEVFNSRCLLPESNRQAQEFAERNGLISTAGSDAHSVWEVGRALVLLPSFQDADELRVAIRNSTLKVRHSPYWVHFLSRYASMRKRFP